MSPRLRSAIIRYGLAVSILFLADLVRLAVDPIMGGGGFTVFIAAVILISWVGGLGPALLGFVLSILLSAFFFSSPETSESGESIKVWTGITVFFVITVASALLSEALRAARRRARWEADEAIRQREQLRTTLACIGGRGDDERPAMRTHVRMNEEEIELGSCDFLSFMPP